MKGGRTKGTRTVSTRTATQEKRFMSSSYGVDGSSRRRDKQEKLIYLFQISILEESEIFRSFFPS